MREGITKVNVGCSFYQHAYYVAVKLHSNTFFVASKSIHGTHYFVIRMQSVDGYKSGYWVIPYHFNKTL